MPMRTPPEYRARTRRWARYDDEKKTRDCHRRDDFHRKGDASARDAHRRERDAGFDFYDDAEKPAPAPLPSSPVKKKKPPRWLPSRIGAVFGSLCRVESVDGEVSVPGLGAVAAPTPSSTTAIGYPEEGADIVAPEAAHSSLPTQGVASSTTTTSGLLILPPRASTPAPQPPPSSSLSQEIDDRYREDLEKGRVAPDPEPTKPVDVDKEAALCRHSATTIATERTRFVMWLQKTEMKAKRDALFMQNARPEHLRALGIDAAMEHVVSSQRPRDGHGRPIVSQKHPCSPVEKLGLFLKPL